MQIVQIVQIVQISATHPQIVVSGAIMEGSLHVSSFGHDTAQDHHQRADLTTFWIVYVYIFVVAIFVVAIL